MKYPVDGKVALITGAAGGLGTARALHKRGASIVRSNSKRRVPERRRYLHLQNPLGATIRAGRAGRKRPLEPNRFRTI